MSTRPFVIVGGDAAGLSAASKCKREEPDRDVIVFEKGNWISYAHCGLPYFIGGVVDSLSDLLSLSPTQVRERGIDLRRNHEVIAVNPAEQTVTVRCEKTTFEQPFGNLLIGTGARPVSGPFDLSTLDGVFTVHGIDSAAAIDAYLSDPEAYDESTLGEGPVDRDQITHNRQFSSPHTAAIVGGGYVGVEMAEALIERGLDVHLFQRSGHILPPFGDSIAAVVEPHLRSKGVHVHTDTPVTRLVGDDDDRVSGVQTASETIDAQLVIVGVGIRPNTDLLSETEISIGEGSAIRTDEYGRTSLQNIYAAGDVATSTHTVTGEETWVPLGLTANRAGRAIGTTVAGTETSVGEIAGTAVLKAFDLECGRTGIIDKDDARNHGFDPISATITAGSRSGYYPGNSETTVTLVCDQQTERLLGGAIVGSDRAAVRINTIATALQADRTVSDVERLDLAYAPPFSPVWDPILVAAKVLNGKL
ncbi:FAD-dependent oxidoreductase [Halorubraceae archaeon YAN]|nr:FAD-dependent oxidoreductase [Halorubraceae archaeon YAN]